MCSTFQYLEPAGLENDILSLRLQHFFPEEDAVHHVPTYRFDIVGKREDAVVGSISLKVGNNDNIRYVGHIGFGIFPPFRRNGYAGQACRLLFPFVRRHGMDHVIITCDPGNTASARTIERLGGALLETVEVDPHSEYYYMGGRCKNRYRVDLP